MTTLDAHPRLTLSFGRLYDPSVVFIAGVLMTLGVAMVYSASVTIRGSEFTWRQWWNSPLKQCVFALAGFLAMLVAAHVDYRVLAWERRRDAWRVGLLVLMAGALLVAVLVPGIGKQVLGARRAIEIPGVRLSFQPSEFAKVVMVIWLAALLTRPSMWGTAQLSEPSGRGRRGVGVGYAAHDDIARDFRWGYLPALLSCGLLIGLTAIEDFGTAALMGAVMTIMLLVGGARWSHLGLTFLLGVAAAVPLVILKPHRVARITTFLNETPDPAGAGYQINQAMLAIGSGGWWGRGLGAGIQKYGYLPQDNNDFILAIICEELGVVGGICVAVLFLALLWRGWRIAMRAPDRFGQLLAIGLTMTICIQAAFNIGVVTHSVPTKGISLPFVSAGGSGVVFLGLAAGLLAAVGRPRGEVGE